MPRRFLLVLATVLLSVLLYIDRICISTAKESITQDLNLTDEHFGWALSAFALGYALLQTPAGWLADRFGPRRVLTAVVVFWSIFTGLTGAAYNFTVLLITRLLFGAGEAGAFPGIARASFSWIPMSERGIVQGANFGASRLGAAAALFFMPALILALGWRTSFVVLMFVGFLWAIIWYLWFRDDPTDVPNISPQELEFILSNRQQSKADPADSTPLSLSLLARSRNVWVISAQYFCCNFTFFFCLTWLFPHMKKTFDLGPIQTGIYSAAPLICGAFGNWLAGWLVDRIYRNGHWVASRRIPAMLGYFLAAVGLVLSVYAGTALWKIIWFSLAIFGTDMTLPPSWSFCIDVGRRHAGIVSGTMNTAGNVGAFVTALAFPYLAAWTGSNTPFFFVAAALNLVAVGLWMFARPDRPWEEY